MLSKRLRELRIEKGLSQYKAADLLGYSRGKLSNYEQGSREPDYDTLEELANFYNVTVEYLLGRTDDKHLTEVEKTFVDDEKTLTVRELKEKYELSVDGKKATKEEIEGAIAFIRSLREMK